MLGLSFVLEKSLCILIPQIRWQIRRDRAAWWTTDRMSRRVAHFLLRIVRKSYIYIYKFNNQIFILLNGFGQLNSINFILNELLCKISLFLTSFPIHIQIMEKNFIEKTPLIHDCIKSVCIFLVQILKIFCINHKG